MPKNNSLKTNLVFQTLYQILDTCLPLITAPYLARVLGVDKLGVFSYTSSIVSYFVLIAMLGTMNYGTRSIASTNDKEERSTKFWEIYFLQFAFGILSIVTYSVYLIFFCEENTLIALIQTLAIVNCLFNINWLFFGMEMFKITVTRNTVIRVLTVSAILLLVKKPEDLWLYTIIMLLGSCFSQLILWWFAKDLIVYRKPSLNKVVSHIGPNVTLFIPLLAMSVYHSMDKTMLGALSNYRESGFYYNSDKVINIPVGIISGISTVMLPRMTSLINLGKNKEADELFQMTLEGTALVGSAIAFGIASISNEFIPLFFGEGYESCVALTIVLAPVLVIKSFSFTARNQYLIPHKKEKDFTISVIIGAIVNVIINAVLIPSLGAMGAVIGTVIAEFCACIWQFWGIRKSIDLRRSVFNSLFYVLLGLIMMVSVRMIANLSIEHVIVRLFIEIFGGAFVFLLLSFVFWKITNNQMPKQMFGSIPIISKFINIIFN